MKKIILGVALAGVLAIAGAGSASALENYGGYYLRMGTPGPDANVMTLQQCLIDEGYSNAAGVDGYFGPVTDMQVRAYQKAKNVMIDGIVGPVTWKALDCEEDSMTEEEEEESMMTDGTEGSVDSFDDGSPAETELEEGETGEIFVIEVELDDEGDLLMERLDLFFQMTSGGSEETEPWEYFEKVAITADGDEIAEMDVDDEDDWDDQGSELYRLRMSGLEYVLESDETTDIAVEVTTMNVIDSADLTADWTVSINNNSFRLVDGTGFVFTDGDNSVTDTFGLEGAGGDDDLDINESDDDPEATTLKVDDSDTSEWFDIFMFELEVDEDSSDLEFDEITLSLTTSDDNVSDVIDDLVLNIGGQEFTDWDYGMTDTDGDGTVELDNTTGNGATALVVFDIDGDLVIDMDDMEEVTLEAKFKNTTAYTEGDTIMASAAYFFDAETNAAANDENTTCSLVELAYDVEGGDDLVCNQISGSIDGEAHELRTEGIIVTFGDIDEMVTAGDLANDDIATFSIEMTVKAFETTAYIPQAVTEATAANSHDFDIEASGAVAAVFSGTLSDDTNADCTSCTNDLKYKINENAEETFTFTLTSGNTTAGQIRAVLENILWTSNPAANGVYNSYQLDLDESETGYVYVN